MHNSDTGKPCLFFVQYKSGIAAQIYSYLNLHNLAAKKKTNIIIQEYIFFFYTQKVVLKSSRPDQESFSKNKSNFFSHMGAFEGVGQAKTFSA